MSNSPLISYTRISPNKNSPRTHVIDTISIHCVVGQCSVETLSEVFAPTSRKASSNYGIGSDGRIGMYVEEKDRSWCTSSSSNDNRAITIEVASDTKPPYAVNDAAYKSLIDLLVDICQRNNIKQLLWKGDKSLIGQVDKQNMTVHKWFANKDCPGAYLYDRHSQIAAEVNRRLGNNISTILYCVQTGAFKDVTGAEQLAKRVENAGFETCLTFIDDMYKVQVGAYANKQNAEDTAIRLRAAGFETYITKKQNPDTKKSPDQIAVEVIDGEWGNGADRRKRLTEAGYDYDEVQKIVNEKCK